MQRWIGLVCMAVLVISALVTVGDASWPRSEGPGRELDPPEINGVTPTSPPTPAPTPTSPPTPVSR